MKSLLLFQMKGRNFERVEKVCPVVTTICWIYIYIKYISLFLANAGIFFFISSVVKTWEVALCDNF